MLSWALIFFLLAIVAAVFGFTSIVADAGAIARVLFYVFAGLFSLLLLAGLTRRS